MNARRLMMAAAAAAVALPPVGCGGGSSSDNGGGGSGSVKEGGIFRVGTTNYIDSLNVFIYIEARRNGLVPRWSTRSSCSTARA